MKILVFEYITGGGFAGQPLPASLAAEGGMMLQALLAELKCLDDIRLCVPLDERYDAPALLSEHETVSVGPDCNITSLLADLLTDTDLFWPIAPESDGILQGLAELAAAANVEVLLSHPTALAICADKYATYQTLVTREIPLVETRLLRDGAAGLGETIVVKMADGVGCMDSVVINAEQLPAVAAEFGEPQRYVLQPYIEGRAASLSCLFRRGQAWLICYNHQKIVLDKGRFSLHGCSVNVRTDKRDFYQELVSRIAAAMPGLWGYVGIDVIENVEHGPLVLEINPRLTSSYVGIRQATGINVAEQVLRLRHTEADLRASRHEAVLVNIH